MNPGMFATNLNTPYEASAKNTGTVTLVAGSTTILTLDVGSVVAGDRLLATSYINTTKGATAGQTSLVIEKDSGSAVIAFGVDSTVISFQELTPINAAFTVSPSGVIRVTTGGNLVLRLRGNSAGSNAAIVAGDAQLHVLRLRYDSFVYQ